MGKLFNFCIATGLLMGMASSALAGTASLTGTFLHDSEIQIFNFDLLTDGTVTLQTFGYGGGINAAGATIAAGGFEPTLQIFDSPSGAINGGSILPGQAPNCAPRNPDPNRLGFCRDVYAQVFLTAGSYFVALTENPNVANGSNYSFGFYADADPASFDLNGFADVFGQPGDGHWALDIVTPGSASVPEPGSALMAASASLLVGLGIRKRVR